MNNIFAIIVNFHSDEKVARLVKAIKKAVVKTIVIDNNQINRGFAKGVNLGIKQALEEKADSILLLNPDVAITSKQITELAKSSGDIVGPVLTFNRQGKKVYDFGGKVNWLIGRTTHFETTNYRLPTPDSRPDLDPQQSEDRNRECDYLSGACILIRREVFEKIGLFDEKYFLYFEDADFCLRAQRAGFMIKVTKDVVLEHQISEHRVTKDKFKIEENLKSNWLFIRRWVPWYFQPFAISYFFLLKVFVRLK